MDTQQLLDADLFVCESDPEISLNDSLIAPRFDRRPMRQDSEIVNLRVDAEAPPSDRNEGVFNEEEFIFVSTIDPEVVIDEDANLLNELKTNSKTDTTSKKALRDKLGSAEVQAKRRLIFAASEQNARLRRAETQASSQSHKRQIAISKEFRKAEETMKTHIKSRNGEVITSLGQLNETTNELYYGGDRRRYQITWCRRP
jgi:hypothetical protein